MPCTETVIECLRVTAPAPLADPLELALEAMDAPCARWCPAGSGQVVVEAYFETRDDAARAANALRLQLVARAPADAWAIEQESRPARDWEHAWKAFFHVERVSPRIVIRPSWETYEAGPEDCVIEMDPGMSFGTGQHETTRACLRFLDTLTAACPPGCPPGFLDIGCGSGILAIAAARLGCRHVAAYDIDPDAVRIATANIALNGCRDRVSAAVGDAAALETTGPFGIVAANILAPVLVALAPAISRHVAAGGHLLLAGMLNEQYPGVAAAYRPLGFEETGAITEKEWTSACLRRNAGPCS